MISTASQRTAPAKLTLSHLESLLLKACDILRGNIDASEYKEAVGSGVNKALAAIEDANPTPCGMC